MKIISKYKSTIFLLLILNALWLVVACSSGSEKISLATSTSEEWAALVDKTIPETERASKVKELGFRLLELADSTSAEIMKLSNDAALLGERYQCTKEEWQKLFSDFTEVRKANFAKYRDVLFAMRKEVNEKEWKELTD
jgi:hypothetical protein